MGYYDTLGYYHHSKTTQREYDQLVREHDYDSSRAGTREYIGNLGGFAGSIIGGGAGEKQGRKWGEKAGDMLYTHFENKSTELVYDHGHYYRVKKPKHHSSSTPRYHHDGSYWSMGKEAGPEITAGAVKDERHAEFLNKIMQKANTQGKDTNLPSKL